MKRCQKCQGMMSLERDSLGNATAGSGWAFELAGGYWSCLMCGRREYVTPGDTRTPRRRRDAGMKRVRVVAA